MKSHKFNITILLILFSLLFSLTNCTKEGPIGPAGADGADGADGSDGAANIENFSITVTPSQWIYNDTYKIWYYRYNINKNSNSLVYGYVMSGNGFQAMPYHQKTSFSDKEYTFATRLFGTPQYVELQYANFKSPTTKPKYDKLFSLIIVPSSENKANIDFSDYDSVVKYYNLTY